MPTDQPSTLRIGTWNVNVGPGSDPSRKEAIEKELNRQRVDIWLLTEVHEGWQPRGRPLVTAPHREMSPTHKRLAAIDSSWPIEELRPGADEIAAADEGLSLARVTVNGTSVLVACSVLPWAGAGNDWPGMSGRDEEVFARVLARHRSRIEQERAKGDDAALVWGGDFNQALLPPRIGGTERDARAVAEALNSLGLTAVTADAENLDPAYTSIDHIAVSRELLVGAVDVHRLDWKGGPASRHHAAYTADVVLPRT